jgi:hypothetical protein
VCKSCELAYRSKRCLTKRGENRVVAIIWDLPNLEKGARMSPRAKGDFAKVARDRAICHSIRVECGYKILMDHAGRDSLALDIDRDFSLLQLLIVPNVRP